MGVSRWCEPSANAPTVILNARIGEQTEPIQAPANSVALSTSTAGSLESFANIS